VGYVISGSARLDLEGQTLNLKAGDSWLVPAGAMHQYTILEPFSAVEATAPPPRFTVANRKLRPKSPKYFSGARPGNCAKSIGNSRRQAWNGTRRETVLAMLEAHRSSGLGSR
jgi:Cupin domain